MEYHGEEDTCTGCGTCVEVCAHAVLELVDKRPRFKSGEEKECIRCGHCIMVCPNGSARHSELAPDGFYDLPKSPISPEDASAFLQARRSCRVFKKQKVPHEMLERLIEIASTAPMGFPPHTTEFLVFDTPEKVREIVPYLDSRYAKLGQNLSSPIGRQFVRWIVGAPMMHTLRTHVIPVTLRAHRFWEQEKRDRYLCDAPAMLVLHGYKFSTSYLENALIALTYASLAAHTLGLGSTISGLVPPIINRSPELRRRYGISAGNEVIGALMLGYPKYRFKRGMRRPFHKVEYV